MILFFSLLCPSILIAQNSQFKKGQIDLQLGIGFLSTLNQNLKSGGYSASSSLTVPPVSVSTDFGITDEISLGGTLAYAKTHQHYEGMDLGDVSHFIIGLRGLYHFELVTSLDTYAGAMLGYNVHKISDASSIEKVNGLAYTLLVGGRYRFSKSTGVFLELGYGVASVNVGLNFKL